MTSIPPLRRSDRSDRGAIIVEAAFILPMLFMAVIGLVTYGMALGQRNSLENAAREASRYGATLPVTSTNTWLDSVSDVAVTASTGDLDAGAPDRYVCVALVGTAATDGRRVLSGTSAPTYSSGNCPNTACPSAAPCVQVVLSRSVTLDAVAFKHTVTIDAGNMSVFERAS